MKVVCDNCRAVYKVPDAKLTKPVNKATCRQCGHRMLIPKPKPGADPDERTLVTAVPPTPPGAPSRDVGPHTPPIEEEPEHTLPGRPPDDLGYVAADTQRDEVPIFLGTPLPAPRDEPPRPSLRPSQVDTAVEAVPEPTKRAQGQRPRTHTPAPAPAHAPPHRVVAEPAHDPAGDMSWALLGAMAGLVGAFMLAFLALFEDATLTGIVMWAGLLMSFGGGSLTILILLSSGRGRRPAYPLTSFGTAFVFAVIASSMTTSAQVATKVVLASDIQFALPSQFTAATSPAPAPEPSLASAQPEEAEADEPADVAEDGDAVADAEQAEDAPEDEPVAPEEATPADAPKAAPKEQAPKEQAPKPEPAKVAASAPAPPAPTPPSPAQTPPGVAPAAVPAPAPPPPPQGPPMEAVHPMIAHNLEVKKCFVPLIQSGQKPSRVDLRVVILPTGAASTQGVTQTQYTNTDFERCLDAAIRRITFPPSPAGAKLTYPFILQ